MESKSFTLDELKASFDKEIKERFADPKNATVLQMADAIDKIIPKLGIDTKEVDTKQVKFTIGNDGETSTEAETLYEYSRAINNLTIKEENRLSSKSLAAEIAEIKKKLN